VSGRLTRVGAYLAMGFGAAIASGPPADPAASAPLIAMARTACRDPDAGEAAGALARIDELLATAEQALGGEREQTMMAFGLIMAAGAIAATEPC
jgi:hypothetical protein